jgi:hypothetical protein
LIDLSRDGWRVWVKGPLRQMEALRIRPRGYEMASLILEYSGLYKAEYSAISKRYRIGFSRDL